MRELSEQEIENVSGGTSLAASGFGPLCVYALPYDYQLFAQPPIVVPQLNIVENFFSNNPDS